MESGVAQSVVETGVPDLHELAEPGSVMESVMRDIKGHLDELPVMSESAQRAILALHDPLGSLSSVADEIETDATMSTKVLRVANSALYGGIGEVNDVRVACTRLGLRALAQIVTAQATKALFKPLQTEFREALNQYWDHAAKTAIAAEEFSEHVEEEAASWLFISGILHNIGKPVLLNFILAHHQHDSGMLSKDVNLLKREVDRFHRYVGLAVAEHWRLPDITRAAILWSEEPQYGETAGVGKLCHALRLASSFACMRSDEGTDDFMAARSSLHYIGIDLDQTRSLFSRCGERMRNRALL